MRNKQIKISLEEEWESQIRAISAEQNGKPNVSGWVRALIIKKLNEVKGS